MAVVSDWDAVLEDREGDGVFAEGVVVGEGGEADLVVVFKEGTGEGGVRAGRFHGVDAVYEISDAAAGGLEGLGYPVVA